MGLHYIYIVIGLLTVILNGMLTFHVLYRGKGKVKAKDTYENKDTVVFYLSGRGRSCEEATVTEQDDDTLLLER